MAGRAKRNAPDNAAVNADNKDNVPAPAIPEAILTEFLAALTSAITTPIATAVSSVRPAPTPR